MRRKTLLYFSVVVLGGAACGDMTSQFATGLFASAAGGFQHTCALLGEGTLYCWGGNGQFQLGYGATGNTRDSLPRLSTTSERFLQVDASEWHSCAVTNTGATYCWGTAFDGELGSETLDQAPTPVRVDGGVLLGLVTLGKSHSCGLSLSGGAYCWGLNDLGTLGRDTTSTRTPVPVAGGFTYVDLAAGDYHTCGVISNGAALCWGSNSFGQVGTGDTATVGTYREPAAVNTLLAFEEITAGNVHTCALTPTGQAHCWGDNLVGMVGDGSQTERRTPVAVAGNLAFASITAGAGHTCALTPTFQLYCWGDNRAFGGTGTTMCPAGSGAPIPCSLTPVRVAQGLNFRSVAAGAFHTCAILVGGGAHCWGLNSEGQVGNGAVGAPVATPTRIIDP